MDLNAIFFPAPKSSYTTELLHGELVWIPKYAAKSTNATTMTSEQCQTCPTTSFDDSMIKKQSCATVPDLAGQKPYNRYAASFHVREMLENDNDDYMGIVEDCTNNMKSESSIQAKFLSKNTSSKPIPKKRQDLTIKVDFIDDSQPRGHDTRTTEDSFDPVHTDEGTDTQPMNSPRGFASYSTKAFDNPLLRSKESLTTRNFDSKPLSFPSINLKTHQKSQSTASGYKPQPFFTPQSKTSSAKFEFKMPLRTNSEVKKLSNFSPEKSLAQSIEYYIPCLLLKPGVSSDKIIVYFHGNGEDVNLAYDLLGHLRNNLNVNILAVEYPGYGLYHGTPNEATIKQDAEAVYDFLIKIRVKPQNTIIFGRSIGSGPATHLASCRKVGALVLMSAFTSIRDAVKDFVGKWAQYLVKQKFNNLEAIAKVTCPTFLIHGQKDTLIPFAHSEALHSACNGTCELVLPKEMDHIEFDFYDDFTAPLMDFLLRCNFELEKTPAIYFPRAVFKTPEQVLMRLRKKNQNSPTTTTTSDNSEWSIKSPVDV